MTELVGHISECFHVHGLCSKTHYRLHQITWNAPVALRAVKLWTLQMCGHSRAHWWHSCFSLSIYIHDQQKKQLIVWSQTHYWTLMSLDVTIATAKVFAVLSLQSIVGFAWDQLWTQLAMDTGVDQPGLWMRLSIYWKNGFVWEFGTSKSLSPREYHQFPL